MSPLTADCGPCADVVSATHRTSPRSVARRRCTGTGSVSPYGECIHAAGRRAGEWPRESCEGCLARGGIWASGESGVRGVGKRWQVCDRDWAARKIHLCYVNVPAIDLNERTNGRVGGLVAIFRLSASQEITRRRRALMYTHHSISPWTPVLHPLLQLSCPHKSYRARPTTPAAPDAPWSSLASARPPASLLAHPTASALAAPEAPSRRRARRR